ncbi:MAG: 30S ribosomal protein S27e [Thermoplasmata archaeon]
MRAPAPFWVVQCPDCSGEQTVFSRPAGVVNCLVCGATLATPTGGQAKLRGKLLRLAGA